MDVHPASARNSVTWADLDQARLRTALAYANIATLIPLLVRFTGDRRWLANPYRPNRPRGIDDHDDGGLPPEIQQEIRDTVAVALNSQGGPARLRLIDLAKQKWPVQWYVVEALPMSAAGKVQKQVLRDQLSAAGDAADGTSR